MIYLSLVVLVSSAIFATLQLMQIVKTNFPTEFVVIQLVASIGFIVGALLLVVRHAFTWGIDILLFVMFLLLFYGLFKYQRRSKISTIQLWVIAGGAVVVSIISFLMSVSIY